MPTTIQIGNKMKEKLERMKLSNRDTYNDVLERVLEDLEELDGVTKKELDAARKQIKEGRFKTHEDVGKELGSR